MKTRSASAVVDPRMKHRWGIILAGGSGTRLQQFVKARFGVNRPKQYCALIGKRSMFRHTIDRVTQLFPDYHLLSTISAQHFSWAIDDLHDQLLENVIVQPYNRETGPGILLPLLHVHHVDSQAVVGLFPADHFILQEERYRSFVSKAFDFVYDHPDRIVMLGIVPSSLQFGYGWIEKGETTFSEKIFSVNKFWEKPDTQIIQYLYEKKCLWNTMTLIGTSSNILKVFEEHMNEVFVPLQRVAKVLGTADTSDTTIQVFKTIPSVNFSRAILEKIPHTLSVLEMNGVYWNDWGDEARIRTDIELLEHQFQTRSENETRMEFQSQTNIYY